MTLGREKHEQSIHNANEANERRTTVSKGDGEETVERHEAVASQHLNARDARPIVSVSYARANHAVTNGLTRRFGQKEHHVGTLYQESQNLAHHNVGRSRHDKGHNERGKQ